MNSFNNGPFFFMPFPMDRKIIEDKGEEMLLNKEILDEASTLKYGNAFKNQYNPYKNYEPHVSAPKTKKEEMLLHIMQYNLLIHDLNLHLDIYPMDKDVYTLFEKYNDQYLKLIKEYQDTYCPLFVNESKFEHQFTWVDKINKGGMY